MTDQPRRRADDWKTDSGITLNRRWFHEIAARLGYNPRLVVSIRMNEHEAIVTYHEPRGMRTVRHRLTEETASG